MAVTLADRATLRALLETAIRTGAEVAHVRDWEARQAVEAVGALLSAVELTPGAWKRFLDGARLEEAATRPNGARPRP